MKRVLFLAFFLSVFCTDIVSQITPTSISQKGNPNPEIILPYKILEANITALPMNSVVALKDELIAWKEKVTSIVIDDNAKTLKIYHSELMDERDFFDVLSKYGISKTNIIRYQLY